jgi:hypothetical protein
VNYSPAVGGAAENVIRKANDLYGELTNFWRVLQHPTDSPTSPASSTPCPFSEAGWQAVSNGAV